MSAKDILKLAAIAGLFFLAAPYLLRAVFAVFYTPRIAVGYDTPVDGRISGFYANRQYYVYYLNGNKKTYYDFNAFGQALASGETHRKSGLTQPELDGPGLGTYLKKGDYVSKAAHSTELLVRRNDTITHWACSPKQAKE
ncbi:MAG: hypothetical protein ACRYG7_20220 [Janthinobacterium lividum]